MNNYWLRLDKIEKWIREILPNLKSTCNVDEWAEYFASDLHPDEISVKATLIGYYGLKGT